MARSGQQITPSREVPTFETLNRPYRVIYPVLHLVHALYNAALLQGLFLDPAGCPTSAGARST